MGVLLVPGEGLEPSIHFWPRILSPVRIPIPPPGLEAMAGFAPASSGFADRRVRLLHHMAINNNSLILAEAFGLFKIKPRLGRAIGGAICYLTSTTSSPLFT